MSSGAALLFLICVAYLVFYAYCKIKGYTGCIITFDRTGKVYEIEWIRKKK